MDNEIEYIVLKTTKNTRTALPCANPQEAVIAAIGWTEECAADADATVQIGYWNGKDIEDPFDITAARRAFLYVQQHTEEVDVEGWAGIASGAYYNARAEETDVPLRFDVNHVIYIEDNDAVDMGTDWRTYAVYAAGRFCFFDMDVDVACAQLGVECPKWIQ